MVAASGASLALFGDADGTAQREALRRYLTLTVQPLAAMLERELQDKLEVDVTLNFDPLYAHDLQGRTTAYKNLTANGVDPDAAVKIVGLMRE